jgi:hypothetical protein
MYRALTAIAVVGVLVGLPALASRSKSHAALHRQQMVNCMNGQMSANRAFSYHDAEKVCTDRMNAQNRHADSPSR